MIKNQLFISLLILFSLLQAQGRFLQGNPDHLGRNLQTSNTTYRSDLLCGECIMGNFTYCVRGAEGQVVDTAPTGYCCKDTSSCTYAKNSSWTCSSKYTTTVDKLRVCPFIKNQCGSSSNLNLTGVSDQTCIRLKNLQSGNACLYKVQSQCDVPNFQLNDTTNVVIQYKMISNKTISYSTNSTGLCSNTSVNQSCFCLNITNNGSWRWSCNCTNKNTSATSRLLSFTSSQCTCNSSTSQNKSCTCCLSQDMILQQNQPVCQADAMTEPCTCINVTNSTSKTWSYSCNCKHPQTNISASNLTIGSSLCYCDPTTATNKTCNCCVSGDIIEKQLLPQCGNGTQRQECSCQNVTSGKTWQWKCNCTSKQNVLTSNVNITQANCSCLSATTSSSIRSCDCCVVANNTIPPTNVTNSSSLTCPVGSQIQNCSCVNTTNATSKTWYWNCSCTNKTNGTTSKNLALTSQNCMNSGASFNCCITISGAATNQTTQPTTLSCNSPNTIQNCSCVNVSNSVTKTWSWNCSCTNKTSGVTTKNLTFTSTLCMANGASYNCCVSASSSSNNSNSGNSGNNSSNSSSNSLVCASGSSNQNCSCVNTTNTAAKSWYWNCSCTNSATKVTTKNLNITQANCKQNGTAYNCCVATTATNTSTGNTTNSTTNQTTNTSTCATGTSAVSCSCVNTTNTTSKTWYWNCTCTNKNVTYKNLNLTSSQCSGSGSSYSCCVSNTVFTNTSSGNTSQPTVTCATGSSNVSCSCVNTTSTDKKSWYWNCSCTNKNVTYKSLNLTSSSCSGSGSSQYCCVSNSMITTNTTTNTTNNTGSNVTASCAKDFTNSSCSCVNTTSTDKKSWYWNCSCVNKNTTYKNLNLTSTSCSKSGTSYYCCVANTVFVNTTTNTTNTTNVTASCAKDFTNSSCSCVNTTSTDKKSWYWNCSCVNKNVTYRSLNLTSSSCSGSGSSQYCCVANSAFVTTNTTNTTNTTQSVCAVGTTNTSCSCVNTTNTTSKTWYWNCSCTYKNVTYKSLTQASTSCAGSGSSQTCCVSNSQLVSTNTTANTSGNTSTPVLSCSKDTTNSSCSCVNVSNAVTKTWQWNCSCTYKNTTYRNLTISNTSCVASGSSYYCCVANSAFVVTNTTTNTTNTTQSCAVGTTNTSCSCVNTTSSDKKSWYWNCSCTSKNVTYKNLNLTSTSCSQSGTTYNCCVTNSLLTNTTTGNTTTNTSASCSANTTNTSCSCVNTTNTAAKSWYWNCSCTSKNVIYKNLNLTSTSCTKSGTSYYCCVAPSLLTNTTTNTTNSSSTQLSCSVGTSIHNASCVNVSNALTKTWYYNCSVTHSNVTIRNLTYTSSQCMANGTVYYCCVNMTIFNTNTNNNNNNNNHTHGGQPQCTNTTCSCVNTTTSDKKSWYWNCSCTYKNATFKSLNISTSSCTKNGTTYNCCVENMMLNITNPGPKQPMCTNTTCSCVNTTSSDKKSWYLNCSCTYKTSTFKNLNLGNNSCTKNGTTYNCCVENMMLNITDDGPGGKDGQPKPPMCTNSTCSCVNTTSSDKKSWYLNCSCTYKNATFKSLNLGNNSCTKNGTTWNCCVENMMLNITDDGPGGKDGQPKPPMCTNSTCSCVNTTSSDKKSWYLNCSCTYKSATFKNLNLGNNSCTKNGTSWNCCVENMMLNITDNNGPGPNNGQQKPPMCTNSTCSCVNTTSSDKKSWYLNCSCTYKSATFKNLNLGNNSCTKNGTSWNCCVENMMLNITDDHHPQQPQCTNTTCSCVNTTSADKKSWYLNCSCTYKTSTFKNLNLGNNSCTKNGTSYNCCVENMLLNITGPNQGGNQGGNQGPNQQPMCTNSTCSCVNTTSSDKKSWYLNCSCTYKNSTFKNLNLGNNSCTKNGTTYNCCVENMLLNITNPHEGPGQMPVCQNSTCSCVNTTSSDKKSWYWNCSCTYKSATFKNLNLTTTSCTKNGTSYNCCVDNKLLNITEPNNGPGANNGGNQQPMCQNTTCSCVNTTNAATKSWYWNCSCTYKTSTFKNLNLTSSSCTKNGTSYNCCVENKLLNISEPNNGHGPNNQLPVCINSTCSCVNTTNTTSKTWYWNCSCTYNSSTFKNLAFTNTSQCTKNGTTYNCCVAPQLLNITVPQHGGNNNDNCPMGQAQQNCSCVNTTNAATKSWYLNCSCTNRGNGVTTKNLTFVSGQSCQGSGSSYNCCVATSSPQPNNTVASCYSSNCTCTNVSIGGGKYTLNCSCKASVNSMTISGQYNITNTSSCKCTTVKGVQTCDCCMTSTQLQKIDYRPQCMPMQQSDSLCTCIDAFYNSSSKATYKLCNCKAPAYNNSVTNINSVKIEQTNSCSCMNVTSGNTTFQYCQCCVNSTLAMPPRDMKCNTTIQTQANCACQNATNSTSKSWYYNCSSCNYMNGTKFTVVSGKLNYTNSQCSCVNQTSGNSNFFNCSCCMTGKSLPAVIPLDEQQCDAANKAPRMNITMNSTNCKYEYEYLVAVVATKNSTVLMELQTYQLNKLSGQYLKTAFLSTFLVLAYLFY